MRYLLVGLMFALPSGAYAGGVDMQQMIQQTAADGAEGLLKKFIAVVSEHPEVLLICLMGLAATLIYTQYRKDFVDLTRKRWKALLRLEAALFGSVVTAIGLTAFFHWGSEFPAGAEFVAGLILAPLTGFGTPLAYDLFLWRLVDRYMRPRVLPSDGGGTP